MLIVGIILVVAGIFDLIAAAVIERRQATSTAGLGAGRQAAAPTLIRRIGFVTIAIGLVLIVIGIAS